MKIYTYQQKGCMPGKREMEDRITAGNNVLTAGYHFMKTDNAGIYAVFDGVGGLTGSAFAASSAARALADAAPPYESNVIRETLIKVHHDLVQHTKTATTATGIVISGNSIHMFHIGNCRLYGLFDGYIRQLSLDQTRYEDLLKSGLSSDEISESAKCMINACLGAKEEFIDQLIYQDISPLFDQCQKLLLTSDGIHDHISIEELEAMLNEDTSEALLEKLAEQTIKNGSEDDISMMVVEK